MASVVHLKTVLRRRGLMPRQLSIENLFVTPE